MFLTITLIFLPVLCSSRSTCQFEVINTDGEDYEVTLDDSDFDFPDKVSVNHLCANLPDNPETLGGKFEGDMAGIPNIGSGNDESGVEYNALRAEDHLWPNGIVPFTVSGRYTPNVKHVIANAIREYSTRTCVKFEPRRGQDNYVHIEPKGSGCWSFVGKVGGKQTLNLGEGCIHKGIIIHELMHAIGFHHEQSRNDRDDWIRIVWENIHENGKDQFSKYSLNYITHLGTQYDYKSIMHYGPKYFSKNDQKTIQTLKPGGESIGNRDGFSDNDITKINKLYKCGGQGGSCSRQANRDIDGGGGLHAVHYTAEGSCCGICQRTERCKAYAWNDYEGGTCWLKTSTGPIIHRDGVTIGIMPGETTRTGGGSLSCSRQSNRDIDGGGGLHAVHHSAEDSCCGICHNIERCKAYAWNDYEGGTCWLKTSTHPIIHKPGVNIGIKN